MRVSVIVANHNYGLYISKTLTSLLSQSMPMSDFEIIVVDDHSTDLSLKLLEPYLDSIRLVKSDCHNGVIAVCNEGFRRARGQYIVRVDADDYVNRSFLEIEAMFLEENKEMDAVCCDYYKVDKRGTRLDRVSAVWEPIACGVMMRRDVGFYAENGDIFEDREFVKRLHPYRIPLPLYRYLQHEDSLTHKVAAC